LCRHLNDDGSKDPSGVHEQWKPSWSNVKNDGGGECGVVTTRRFKTPLNGNAVFFYSFEARPPTSGLRPNVTAPARAHSGWQCSHRRHFK
jgi:hypothetical protein